MLFRSSFAGILNDISADTLVGFRRSSVIPFVAVAALAGVAAPIKWPTDFPEAIFPVKMVQQYGSEIFHHRVLTTDQWGDYLIYKDPTQKVFVDGRSDFYGPSVGNEYIKLVNGRWEWRDIMQKYNFDRALLPIEHPIVQILKGLPEWTVVADDGKVVFFTRR